MSSSNLTIGGRSISGISPAKSCPTVNVGQTERMISMAAGAGLTLYGFARGHFSGLLSAIAGGSLIYRGLSGHCHGYEMMGVSTADQHQNPMRAMPAGAGVKVERSITIHRSADDLYAFWRNLENLPRFMSHLKTVSVLDNRRSMWVAQAPLGMSVEWTAEIITDKEGEVISWRSLEGSTVDNAGSVRFAPSASGQGTEVTVSLKYNPPAGKIGIAVAKLLGEEPSTQIADDLLRFKHIMEAGDRPLGADPMVSRHAK